MVDRRTILGAVALAPFAAVPRAHAQALAWPTQPVRLVVPFAAGGPTDQALITQDVHPFASIP